jgi:serine/threonine protein kinase/tetratricopeptide (TPR) repeat protein
MSGNDLFGWVGHVLDGKLSIEAVAGEGGFGVVYRALHIGFQEHVAVKCLKLPHGLGPRQRESFLRSFTNEARVMRRLIRATPGVVEALDAGAVVSPAGVWTPYISMEWLAGESLELRLENTRSAGNSGMSLQEAVEFLWPVAEAIGVAHAHGIVHCDIKPANIYLAQMASGVAFKVLDFGIARVMTDIPGIERGADDEGGTGMTPRYCAPEQFNPFLGPTGPRTDLYSLALVLLEVASGAAARRGDTLVETVVEAMSQEQQPTFASLGIAASAEAEAVLLHALTIDPEQRCGSVDLWWSMLASAIGAAPPHAPRSMAAPHIVLSSAPSRIGLASPSDDSPVSALDMTVDVATGSAAGARSHLSRSTVVGVVPAAGARGHTPEAERAEYHEQPCTAVILDLAEWQGLFDGSAPAEAELQISSLVESVAAQLEMAGGAVAESSADRVLAVFGVPHAHDNDAERALVTALKSVEDALVSGRAAGMPRGSPLRAAVHMGKCWWMPAAGAMKVRGPVVRDAARLLRLANDGEVLISEGVLSRVAGGFNFRDRTVETSSATDRGFVVEGKVSFRSPLPRGDFLGTPTPLRGRAPESGRVEAALREVQAQRCSTWVEITGAVGMGKTRLLAETISLLAGSEHTFFLLVAQGRKQEQSRTFGLLVSLLRARFGLLHVTGRATIAARIQEQLLQWVSRFQLPSAAAPQGAHDLQGMADDLELLADLVEDLDEEAGNPGDPSSAEPFARSRVIAAVTRVFSLLAAVTPVVVLCDDVHCADAPSVELLGELVERMRTAPFFLLTSRPTGEPALVASVPGAMASPDTIDLGPLQQQDLLSMVEDRTPTGGAAPQLASELARLARGNPALLDESLRLLIDSGVVLRQPGGRWSVKQDALNLRKIPTTLREVCVARFRCLDVHEQRVLAVAALIGEPFWRGAVTSLRSMDPEAPVSDLKQLTDTESVLARLKARGLIEERKRSRVKGDVEYGIIDPVLREVAYEWLPPRLRTELHGAAARWLVEHAGGEGHATAIAGHHEMVGDLASALREHARAAEHAMRYGQNAQALVVCQHMEQLLFQHGQGCSFVQAPFGQRGSLRVADWPSRVSWACSHGDVLQRLGRMDDADALYAKARASIPERERRAGGGARAHEPASLEWKARLDLRQAAAWRLRGDQERAWALAQQARQIAEGTGSPALVAEACHVLSNVCRRRMELDAAASIAREGLRACRRISHVRARTELSVDLLRSLGSAFMAARRPVQAERTCRQAVQMAESKGLSRALSFAINDYAAILYLRGRLQEAIPVFLRSLALKERDGDLSQIAIASSNIAEVLLQVNRLQEALGFAQRADVLASRAGAVSEVPEIARNLAEIYLALERPDDAIQSVTRAVEHAVEHRVAVYLPGALLTAARVLVASRKAALLPSPAHHALEALVKDALRADEAAPRPWASEVLGVLEGASP